MLDKCYPASLHGNVLIDTELLGRVNHLSFRIDDLKDGKMRTDIPISKTEFVSGRFQFTDLNYNLIYKLFRLDRFSTLLTDGDRVFNQDINTELDNISFKIELPRNHEYDLSEIPRQTVLDMKDLFSVPYSILGTRIRNSEPLTIGRQYDFTAKNILFLAQHANNLFQFSLR